MVQPCSTRWSSHESAVTRTCVLYSSILTTLEKLEDEGDSDATALSVLIQNKKFVFVLNALVTILDHTSFLTKTLQNSRQTLSDTRSHIDALKSILTEYRSDDSKLNKLFKLVDEICERENITIFDKVTRRRNDLLKYCQKADGTIDSKLPLRKIFYEIIDLILNGIEMRFGDEAMDIIGTMDQVTNQRKFQSCERLNIIIPDHEGTHFKAFIDNRLAESDSLLDTLNVCDQNIFPNIFQLLLSLAVCPISSVTVERFFSKVNSVMIPSRQSMTSKRLKNLCLLSFERDITARLEKNIARVKSEYYK